MFLSLILACTLGYDYDSEGCHCHLNKRKLLIITTMKKLLRSSVRIVSCT